MFNNKTVVEKGIEYEPAGGFCSILVKGRHPGSVNVTVSNGPDGFSLNGSLLKAEFRSKLAEAASGFLGESNDLMVYLETIAESFEDDREKADGMTATPLEFGNAGYSLLGTGFAYSKEGDANKQPLTNFVAKIKAEVVRDIGVGEEPQRAYEIEAYKGTEHLGTVSVPAEKFEAMNWVDPKLGSRAHVLPAYGAKGKVAHVIKTYSGDVPVRAVFGHTGWRELGGEQVYLHEGMEAPSVSLEGDLAGRYVLPTDPTPEDIREGVRASYALWDLGERRVTVPMVAMAYVGPLATVLRTDFLLYVHGTTGSYKSSLAALVNFHYGDFSYKSLPLNFEGTSNFLERALYGTKDALAVVDDLRPGISSRDRETLEVKLQRLLRMVGNRAARGRMSATLENRFGFPTRGVVMATGEYLPDASAFSSANNRALTVGVSKGCIDFDRLRDADKHRKKLPAAMKGFTDWITPEILGSAQERKDRAFEMFCREGAHKRTPNILADLLVGVELFGEFAVACGALGAEEVEIWRAEAVDALSKAGAEHSETVSANNPADVFIEELRAGFDAGAFYVCDRTQGFAPLKGAAILLGWERGEHELRTKPGAQFVGWVDDDYFYLDPSNVYRAINGRGARSGKGLGLSKDALWRLLKEKDYVIAEKKSGYPTTNHKVARGENDAGEEVHVRQKRVLQMERKRVLGL